MKTRYEVGKCFNVEDGYCRIDAYCGDNVYRVACYVTHETEDLRYVETQVGTDYFTGNDIERSIRLYGDGLR